MLTTITATNAGTGSSITPMVIPIGTATPVCAQVGIAEPADASVRASCAPVPAHDVVQVTLSQAWLREGPLTLTLRMPWAERCVYASPAAPPKRSTCTAACPAFTTFWYSVHAVRWIGCAWWWSDLGLHRQGGFG